jgi:probable rRNA maturation factor
MISLHIKHRPAGAARARLNSGELLRFALRAAMAAGVKSDVSLIITSSQEMHHLNRRFRHVDRPTDVLSFHSSDDVADYAGDIAISSDIAFENGRSFGHSTMDEVKVLMLHGMLHLAGYDHESDDGRMARKESKLRQELGLPSNLIARSSEARKKKAALAKSTGKRQAKSRAKARARKSKQVRGRATRRASK